MKNVLIISLLSICGLQSNSQLAYNEKPRLLQHYLSFENNDNGAKPEYQADQGKISAAVFKAQEYCRAEVERFDFEAHFSITGATVYFSGTNFKGVEKGIITSSSLKSISGLMARCAPGSIVVFDDIKVVGPDKKQRTIQSVSYILY